MVRASIWASVSDALKVTVEKGSLVTIEIKPVDGAPSLVTFTGAPDQLASFLRVVIKALTQEHALPEVEATRGRLLARPVEADAREEAKSA